mgnify:FL=1
MYAGVVPGNSSAGIPPFLPPFLPPFKPIFNQFLLILTRFTKHYFHPDETTTSRVESAHRALKVSLYSPKYDSLALAETFAVAVDRQNINIIQDIERQRNQHRSTKVSVSLGAEWQVSKEAIEKAILIYNKWTSP